MVDFNEIIPTIDDVEDVIDDAMETVYGVKEAMEDTIDNVTDPLEDVVGDAIDDAKGFLGGTLDKAAGMAKDFGVVKLGELLKSMAGDIGVVEEAFGTAVDDTYNFLTGADCGQTGTSGASVGTGVGGRPEWVPEEDWAILIKYADGIKIDPYLICAMGKQETNWGKAGAGRKGYVLGFGVPDSGALEGFSGMEFQIKSVCERLGVMYEITGHMMGQQLQEMATDHQGKQGPMDLVIIQKGLAPGSSTGSNPERSTEKGATVSADPGWKNRLNSNTWGKKPFSKDNGVWGYHTTDAQIWYKNVKSIYLDLQKLRDQKPDGDTKTDTTDPDEDPTKKDDS